MSINSSTNTIHFRNPTAEQRRILQFMDPSENFAAGNASDQQNQRRQLQISGPRPSPLSVHKDSHKIRKPPKHPAPPQKDQAPPYAAAVSQREPVVIYALSPKVIYTTASEFMNVVQRHTGISSGVFIESSSGGGSGGDVSPAARLAATENASPRGGGAKEPTTRDETEGNGITKAMEEAAEFGGYAPGILSPSPAMLPLVSPGMFTSAIPPELFSPGGLMSPFLMTSPHYTSLISSPTFADFFSQIWDP